MSFSRAWVEVTCDACGLESEPCDLGGLANGSYSLDGPIRELRKDGWEVDQATMTITCADCLSEATA